MQLMLTTLREAPKTPIAIAGLDEIVGRGLSQGRMTGAVSGTESIGKDITQRKGAEEVLAQCVAELGRFHRSSVGGDLQMVEINANARRADSESVYNLAYLDAMTASAK